MKSKEEFFCFLRSKIFIRQCVELMENDFGDRLFGIGSVCEEMNTPNKICGIEYENGKKINQGDGIGVITVMFSKPWEISIERILKQNGFLVKRINSSRGDYEIDYICEGRVKRDNWELKTTMGDAFQGATNSLLSKDANFILVKYKIDMYKDIVPGSQKGLFREIFSSFFSFAKDSESKWCGEPTMNNSRTSLRISSKDCEEFKKNVSFGDIVPKRKWCHMITERL